MAKKYVTFKAEIEYKVEIYQGFDPTAKDEAINFRALLKSDPEIVRPKVTVVQVTG